MESIEYWEPIKLDEAFAGELGGMTVMQLKYLICRLAFPEYQIKECGKAAGYSHPAERSSEMERKLITKELLARCERKLRDGEEADLESMEREDLIHFHESVIRDPLAQIREKQASARDLAELRKWIKTGAVKESKADDFMQMLEDEMNARKSATTINP